MPAPEPPVRDFHARLRHCRPMPASSVTRAARPAATLVIFREGEGGSPELLIMQRSRDMAFAAGALVFPGGRVDEGDHVLAARHAHAFPQDEAAARIGAIRETLEESGLGIGLSPMPDGAVLAEIRRRMEAGEGFAALLADFSIGFDLDALIPFARWRPDSLKHARIYDTRFYLARLPEGSPDPVADATETIRLFWSGAGAVLDSADRGEAHIIFPTRRNLERLAQFPDFASARDHARRHPVETITPWIEEREGGRHLCIPAHLGYPVTSEPIATALRG